jgi:hypothetical protein
MSAIQLSLCWVCYKLLQDGVFSDGGSETIEFAGKAVAHLAAG